MRDRLTKERVKKVDYLLIIAVSNLEREFFAYQIDHPSKRSIRRQAYTFCLKKKVDVESIYYDCLERGIYSYEALERENIRLAKLPWLDED